MSLRLRESTANCTGLKFGLFSSALMFRKVSVYSKKLFVTKTILEQFLHAWAKEILILAKIDVPGYN